jgi:hypothetical protein
MKKRLKKEILIKKCVIGIKLDEKKSSCLKDGAKMGQRWGKDGAKCESGI